MCFILSVNPFSGRTEPEYLKIRHLISSCSSNAIMIVEAEKAKVVVVDFFLTYSTCTDSPDYLVQYCSNGLLTIFFTYVKTSFYDLKRKALRFCPLSMMWAVGLSHMAFIMLRNAPSIPTLLSVFTINGCCTLSNAFSASIDMIM